MAGMFKHERLREFDGCDETKIGSWLYLGGWRDFSCYIDTTGAIDWVGTINLETSYDGKTVHGAAIAMVEDNNAANIRTEKCWPYVRINVAAYTQGTIVGIWIVSVP